MQKQHNEPQVTQASAVNRAGLNPEQPIYLEHTSTPKHHSTLRYLYYHNGQTESDPNP